MLQNSASKDLHERLAKRKKESAPVLSESATAPTRPITATEVHPPPSRGGETQAQRLNKYLSQLREDHRLTMNRLKQFIEKEKRVALRHVEMNVYIT